jgi:sugar lactone lactonase YvrE|tara:strand:- start:393 stop:1268 length:876 start_codon:yes stop_codon:yes gene_type:complete
MVDKLKIGDPKIICPKNSILGEGPIWMPDTKSLMWLDIKGESLHTFSYITKNITDKNLEKTTTWILPIKNSNTFLVGTEDGVEEYNYNENKFELKLQIEEDLPNNRLNDAKIDKIGNLWFGTMDDTENEKSGSFYCLKPNYELIKIDDSYTVTNGPAITYDDKKLYHVSSLQKKVFCYEKNNTTLSNKRIFFELDKNDGYPDGLTIDDENFIWLAVWGGAKVLRISPDGEVDKTITFPTSQITSCVFGGSEMNILFVTSASVGKILTEDVHAGNLFSVETNSKGFPSPHFG